MRRKEGTSSARGRRTDDLVLLPKAREGKRHYLGEKVFGWLQWAVEHAPRAAFIGKADMDTLLVWERAAVHLQSWEAAARRCDSLTPPRGSCSEGW